jgi:hypothetical protein
VRARFVSIHWETSCSRRLPLNFWHTKYHNVKLPVFSAFPQDHAA